MNRIAQFIWKEVREMIPPVIFFFIAFHILVLFRAPMLKGYGVRVSAVAGATVAALVVGKVVLIADAIPAINRIPQKPLIFNVVWKTVLYMIVAMLVHYLEHLIPLWWRDGSFAGANRRLFGELVWPHFWAINLWLLFLFFLYCALRELIRALGRDEVKRLFLGTVPTPRD